MTAILSARNAGVLMSKELFDGLGAKTITVLDSDGSSAVENVRAILEKLIAAKKADTFYTCGSARLLFLTFHGTPRMDHHVLEHVHELNNYMEQFQKLLKPDGILFIAVPNHDCVDESIYKELESV